MNVVILTGLFILGTMFGSLGSVIVQRMQRKISRRVLQGFLIGRSECPQCHHSLNWYNLIPLYSRFSQKGKCSHCQAPISSIYPSLELVSGLIFVLRGWVYLLPYLVDGMGLSVMILVLWWLLGLLLVRDIYTYELHVPVWFLTIVLAVIHAIVLLLQGEASRGLIVSPLVFLLGFLGIYQGGKYYAKVRFGKTEETFGQGDVMLAPIIGYLFAFQGIGQSNFVSQLQLLLVFVLLSSLVGLVYHGGAKLVYSIKKQKNTEAVHSTGATMIPFLPAMIVAYFLFDMLVNGYAQVGEALRSLLGLGN